MISAENEDERRLIIASRAMDGRSRDELVRESERRARVHPGRLQPSLRLVGGQISAARPKQLFSGPDHVGPRPIIRTKE